MTLFFVHDGQAVITAMHAACGVISMAVETLLQLLKGTRWRIRLYIHRPLTRQHGVLEWSLIDVSADLGLRSFSNSKAVRKPNAHCYTNGPPELPPVQCQGRRIQMTITVLATSHIAMAACDGPDDRRRKPRHALGPPIVIGHLGPLNRSSNLMRSRGRSRRRQAD